MWVHLYTDFLSINTKRIFLQFSSPYLYCKNSVYNACNTKYVLIDYVINKISSQQYAISKVFEESKVLCGFLMTGVSTPNPHFVQGPIVHTFYPQIPDNILEGCFPSTGKSDWISSSFPSSANFSVRKNMLPMYWLSEFLLHAMANSQIRPRLSDLYSWEDKTAHIMDRQIALNSGYLKSNLHFFKKISISKWNNLWLPNLFKEKKKYT